MDQSQYLNDLQQPNKSTKRSPLKSSTLSASSSSSSASSPLSFNSFVNTKNTSSNPLSFSLQTQLRQNLLKEAAAQHGNPLTASSSSSNTPTASKITSRFSSTNYPNFNQQSSFSSANTIHSSSLSSSRTKKKSLKTQKLPPPPPPPDFDIRKSIWQGSIPIRFVLSSDETTSFKLSNKNQPIDYYVTVPRISYLPIYIEKAIKYLRPYLNDPDLADDPYNWWAEYQAAPLKWNWPVGLLYDTIKNNTNLAKNKQKEELKQQEEEENKNKNKNSNSSSSGDTLSSLENLNLGQENDLEISELTLPWTIVLHHKNYPKDSVLTLFSSTTLFEYWMNLVKESCVIRYGSANAIMNLSKDDSDKLWACISQYSTDSYKTFWRILESQYPSLSTNNNNNNNNDDNNNNDGDGNNKIVFKNVDFLHSSETKKLHEYQDRVESSQIKHIPIKVYLPMSSYGIQYLVSPYIPSSSSSSSPSFTIPTGFTSTPSSLSSSSAQSPLSQSIIHLTVSENTTTTTSSHSSSSSPKSELKGIQTLGTILNKHINSLFPSKRRCIIAKPVLHGIEIPLTTPILDLLDTCSYPDGFLHISIVMIDNND